jgi:hypothetical protein
MIRDLVEVKLVAIAEGLVPPNTSVFTNDSFPRGVVSPTVQHAADMGVNRRAAQETGQGYDSRVASKISCKHRRNSTTMTSLLMTLYGAG